MTLVAIALVAGTTSACGDGDGADEPAGLEAAAAKTPPAVPPAPLPTRKAAPRWSTADWGGEGLRATSQGVLVKPDGGEIRGWGDRRVRRHVTALFARMQYDFLTGDMAAVCKHADPYLSSLIFTGVGVDASCEAKLRKYAERLEKRGFKPSPLRFLWVRTYPGAASVWVEDRRGKRFRAPFVQEGNSGWRLELSKLSPTEALAMPLQRSRRSARMHGGT